MRATVARTIDRIKYQPAGSEPVRASAEAVFMRLTGKDSEGAAKIAMLRARREFEVVIEALVESGSWHRVPTFMARVFALLARRIVRPVAEALARKAAADAEENGKLTSVALNLGCEKEARAHQRLLLIERAHIDELLTAYSARWGWDA